LASGRVLSKPELNDQRRSQAIKPHYALGKRHVIPCKLTVNAKLKKITDMFFFSQYLNPYNKSRIATTGV
jgi:hypothetical protein